MYIHVGPHGPSLFSACLWLQSGTSFILIIFFTTSFITHTTPTRTTDNREAPRAPADKQPVTGHVFLYSIIIPLQRNRGHRGTDYTCLRHANLLARPHGAALLNREGTLWSPRFLRPSGSTSGTQHPRAARHTIHAHRRHTDSSPCHRATRGAARRQIHSSVAASTTSSTSSSYIEYPTTSEL